MENRNVQGELDEIMKSLSRFMFERNWIENFSEIDSLGKLQLLVALEEAFRIELSSEDFFKLQTLESLLDLLKDSIASSNS